MRICGLGSAMRQNERLKMAFSGFTPKTSEFLWGIMFNNEREWFLAHKKEYETELNEPFKALAKDVTERMNLLLPRMQWQCHVSRIYRDARRLFGRGPYKEKLWFTVYPAATQDKGPGFWFELGAAQFGYGFGFFDVTPAMMERFRRGIDANPARFSRLAQGIDELGKYTVVGESYKRLKADRGELINKWYNRKWVGVERMCDTGSEELTAKLTDILAESYMELMPMFDYFLEFYFGTGDFSIED